MQSIDRIRIYTSPLARPLQADRGRPGFILDANGAVIGAMGGAHSSHEGERRLAEYAAVAMNEIEEAVEIIRLLHAARATSLSGADHVSLVGRMAALLARIGDG